MWLIGYLGGGKLNIRGFSVNCITEAGRAKQSADSLQIIYDGNHSVI